MTTVKESIEDWDEELVAEFTKHNLLDYPYSSFVGCTPNDPNGNGDEMDSDMEYYDVTIGAMIAHDDMMQTPGVSLLSQGTDDGVCAVFLNGVEQFQYYYSRGHLEIYEPGGMVFGADRRFVWFRDIEEPHGM